MIWVYHRDCLYANGKNLSAYSGSFFDFRDYQTAEKPSFERKRSRHISQAPDQRAFPDK